MTLYPHFLREEIACIKCTCALHQKDNSLEYDKFIWGLECSLYFYKVNKQLGYLNSLYASSTKIPLQHVTTGKVGIHKHEGRWGIDKHYTGTIHLPWAAIWRPRHGGTGQKVQEGIYVIIVFCCSRIRPRRRRYCIYDVHQLLWAKEMNRALGTYRLNWARRTSWGWWDDWDDSNRALAVWGRARYLSDTEAPRNTNFHTWMGKKQFCFFQTAETGNRTPDSGVKGSGANHYPRAPAPFEQRFGHCVNVSQTLTQ